MYRKALGTVLALTSTFSQAADESWVDVATTKEEDTLYQVKAGTWVNKKNKAGNTVYTMTARVVDIKTKEATQYIWYVMESDCVKETGDLTFTSPAGEYMQDFAFSKASDTVSWRIASLLCDIAKLRRDKSL